MVGVINLRRKRTTRVQSNVPGTVTPVSSAGPYQPVAGYVPAQVANISGGASGSGTVKCCNYKSTGKSESCV